VVVGFAVALLPLGSPLADVVYLKNEGRLEGVGRPGQTEGTLRVERGDGSVITISQDDVMRIERKQSPLEELESRLAAAPPGEPGPLTDILVWAREKRLVPGAKKVARRLLDIDSNHELARQVLGYVVFENRWIRKADLKKRKGLVRYEGEWLSRQEKARRIEEALRRQVEGDLAALKSDNSYVRDVSARKVRRIVRNAEPAVRRTLLNNLLHPREDFRTLALAVLGKVSLQEARGGLSEAEARQVAADLHLLVLRETSEEVLELAYFAMARFHPRESFRLALRAATRSTNPEERQRAVEALYTSLRKAYVPELIASLVGPGGEVSPEVLEVLRRALGADFAGDAAAWSRYWQEHRGQYSDRE
jgi:hypothetical protein